MNKVLHVALHGLAIVAQYANMALPVVPDKYKPLVAGFLAFAQGVLGVVNHKNGA